MSTPMYEIRTFGSVMRVTPTIPTFPVMLTVQAYTRDGKCVATARDGRVQAYGRDGLIRAKGL